MSLPHITRSIYGEKWSKINLLKSKKKKFLIIEDIIITYTYRIWS